MKVLLLFVFALLFFSGCSSKTVSPLQPEPTQIPSSQSMQIQQMLQSEDITITQYDNDAIMQALYDEYKKWNHTPYEYGGTDKYGVDCSALVQQVYFNALRVPVPRTTARQAKIGYKVEKHRSKAGDLLLFRTGRNTRHSGIYLKYGNFINASSKHGVTISNLNNPYWRSKYWQTRRILP
jgi:cell wall-associated NlpC family hydrolase